MTKRLILMRHSQAAHGGADFDRPLTEHGRRLASLQGSRMALDAGPIDLAIVSSARRCQQTFTALTSGGLKVAEKWDERELYFAGDYDALEMIRRLDDSIKTLLVLFHQPGVGSLTYHLTPFEQREELRGGFSPATFALGEVSTTWESLDELASVKLYPPMI